MTDHQLLAKDRRVAASEVKWYFISDFYDGPISGLALFRGRIVRFCCFPEDVPEQRIYVLQELTEEELAEELRVKQKFELLVGTHGCFDADGKLLPPVIRSEESQKRFFEEEGPTQTSNPHPKDRPVIGWFDSKDPGAP